MSPRRLRLLIVVPCLLAALLFAENPALYADEVPARSLSSYDAQIKSVVHGMTLEEKVGQMTQPDQDFLKDPADIERLFIGSVLSGGNSDPKDGNSRESWTNLYVRLQHRALKTRLRIPLLYGVDAVHGHNNVLGAVVFPHNIGLGCTRNPDLVAAVARATALEVRATGINWTFAPCVTVPRDERWGRTYEGFSEDPKLVARLGAASVRGLQGRDLGKSTSVLACAKHYLGDGGTTFGTSRDGKGLDQGDTRVDEPTLRRIHLSPYVPVVESGVGTIMPSYSSWNGSKLSGHRYLLTDVLKRELGFEGFLISDYNAIDQITKDYREAIKISVNAGMDMVMVPSNYRAFITNLKTLVRDGDVAMARIDDAVTRILRVKCAMGLLDPQWSPDPDPKLKKLFGSKKHRAIARDAVRQSLVLLKNQNRILPLSKASTRIHVAGRCADDIGNQCGGWTIKWQGESGKVTTGGTSILSAIKNTVAKNTNVTFSTDGSGAAGADVGIVVIGEAPYAEFEGDRNDLALSDEDVKVVRQIKGAGIPVVVVLISGRPMIINDVLGVADAFVAAWLPGTEGQGVADVLFGDFRPTGKLAFTWSRSMRQIPQNTGDSDYDPLFKFGFGLSY